MELPDETLERYDTSSLQRHRRQRQRAARRAGAARAWTASGRCSTTSTARPRSRGRRSPGPRTCAPRPAPRAARRTGPSCGCSTSSGSERPAGQTGRIFVGNEMAFEGYTGGGGKEVIAGLMSTGDVGHFDADGRLFVDGRDDEMIVSGGENVFPREVEDLLADHPDVVEAARRRRAGRGVGPAAARRRRARAGGERRARPSSRTTSRRTSRATRSRARSCSSTSCRATRPARCSSASCAGDVSST